MESSQEIEQLFYFRRIPLANLFSNAGKRKGKEDDRHLWPEVARILQEIRPNWFLVEMLLGTYLWGTR
ncbi:DNA cytosine methyltransferase [Paenibacillus larvae]|nr:DNA cytosine methyltransferase [Paenibacillus larvae]